MSRYGDRWIECAADELRIRGYYFPWGTKRIPYQSIRDVRRVTLSVFGGKGRIWGTGNPRYWLNLDPQRPQKDDGLILDTGRWIRPMITPDDTDTVERIIREHFGIQPS